MIHGCIIDMDFGSNIPDVDGTESEVDPTPCGRGGSLEERRCQLFKLTTLAILPAIILIVRDAVKVASDVQMWSEISDVVHAMQKERGTTTLYVSSNGDTYVRTLLNFYLDTDTAFGGLSKWRRISDFRSDLNPLKTNQKQVIEFYSDVNAAFIALIGRSLNIQTDNKQRTGRHRTGIRKHILCTRW
ncbi:hypothetical protein DPMN_125246 [Dreissena polymorpha]|uniref:Nitrate/nitrite sensing protein domain-containing protein n=1 Tax=Dreissena polymorpha TaxID=45954 RepID=A0A9D4JWX3_DREPO|nr:hypothetical protein DPMN_125246 [Dreissena polymorpha]